MIWRAVLYYEEHGHKWEIRLGPYSDTTALKQQVRRAIKRGATLVRIESAEPSWQPVKPEEVL